MNDLIGGLTMEIHFYESINVVPNNCNVLYDWKSIHDIWQQMHDKPDNFNVPEIHTTQMCMLSNTWILKGYHMFVHQDNGIVYEITIKSKDNNGNRAVRIAQNVYAMWANNIFRE